MPKSASATADDLRAGLGSAAHAATGQLSRLWNGTVRGQPAGSFTAAEVPDQTGRTVLITGANSGIGLETALVLARRGARVLLTARDPQRGAVALQRVAATASGPAPELVALDLASLASVRAAAADVADRTDRLDVLVDNAGVMATPQGRTADGFETQIGTNHLGHFALTGLLLPLLRKPRPGPVPLSQFPPASHRNRVVVVSSSAHRAGQVLVSDLNYDSRHYSAWGAYSQSKLANLLFARELQHRADAAGGQLLVASAHPGFAATNLMTGMAINRAPVIGAVGRVVSGRFGHAPAAGALPLLYAATMPDVRPLEYFGPGGVGEMIGAPVRVGSAPAASDDVTAAALWIVSEKLTGVVYDWS